MPGWTRVPYKPPPRSHLALSIRPQTETHDINRQDLLSLGSSRASC